MKQKYLIPLIIILTLLFLALAYFYFFVLNKPAEKVNAAGMKHLFSIYGWGSKEDELLRKPRGVAADKDGNIYVTNTPKGVVAVFDRDGNFVLKFGKFGINEGDLRGPIGISVSDSNNRVYVADRVRFRLVIFDKRGKFIKEVPVLSPVTPYVAKDGKVYLATFGPIVIFDKDGNKISSFGRRGLLPGEFDYPHGLVMDSKGYLYVSDTNNTRIQVLDKKLNVVGVKGQPPSSLLETQREFGLPAGMTIDEKDRLYVVDSFDFSIKVYTNTGKFLAKYGGEAGTLEGQFRYPDGITYMGNKTFAIADTGNDRVQVIRITLPGEESLSERLPWWIWLLFVPPIIWLLSLFGRKKFFADEDFLKRVIEDSNLALLASVANKVYVTEKTYQQFANYSEDEITAADILEPRSYSENLANEISKTYEIDKNNAETLAAVSKRWYEKLLLQRFLLFTENTEMRSVASKRKIKTMSYEEFIEKFMEKS
ncbi:MAG: NHL repeat-containing protein [Actinobacteria bacterium]|nr:NHL repeat-containing protein [Actinomycetota bacterium]